MTLQKMIIFMTLKNRKKSKKVKKCPKSQKGLFSKNDEKTRFWTFLYSAIPPEFRDGYKTMKICGWEPYPPFFWKKNDGFSIFSEVIQYDLFSHKRMTMQSSSSRSREAMTSISWKICTHA